MRLSVVAALFLAIVTSAPAQGQDCSRPPMIANGRHGQVVAGVTLQAYPEPGATSEGPAGQLAPGTLFQVIDEPRCVDGMHWYMVADAQSVWGAWIPEEVNGQAVIEPYVFTPTPPVPFNVPMIPPVPAADSAPLPTVVPVDLSSNDQPGFKYDWSAFIENYYATPPDPLSLVLPSSYQGSLPSLPVNLSSIYFVANAGLNDTQLALLAQNGFVVVPSNVSQFDDAYRVEGWSHDDGKADFITTDALLHSFFLVYQNMLMFLEMEKFYGGVSHFIGVGFLNAQQNWESLVGTPLEAAARNAAVYYAVPLLLLVDGEDSYLLGYDQTSGFASEADMPSAVASRMDPGIRAEAAQIVSMIKAAQGRLNLPILDSDADEDFSQYQPRSYYAGNSLLESYFRAMMWMGRITFRAKSVSETLTSLFVIRALEADESALASYRTVGDLLDFLVGPMDDLSIKDVLPAAQQAFGSALDPQAFANGAQFDAYRSALAQLPAPRVNSIPIGAGPITPAELAQSTKGFRLFGQRFTFDGYAMQQLVYPEVGTNDHSRTLPLGLDIPETLGSNSAYNLADAAGATSFAHYTDNIASLRDEVNHIGAGEWLENLNGGWLWTLQPLAVRDSSLVPPMMQTEAWRRKDLTTFLGSWTELKHATLLYAEQPYGGLGGGGMEPPVISYGYVEPNPQVFIRIAVLSAILHEGLVERGVIGSEYGTATSQLGSSLVNVGALAVQLAEIARKEVAGEQVSYDEYYFMQENFGGLLWNIRYSVEQFITNPPETTALVADVASNAASNEVLHVAIANPDFIYVVTDSPYGLTLTRGAVYSYYDFINPIDQRLTDDQWRSMVAAGSTPARPDWTALYFSP